MKLQPESKKELTRIACGTAICTAVMWVIFAALHLVGWVKFDYTVVLGSLIGAAVAIGNFAGICIVCQKVIDEQDEKRRKATLQASYNVRMLLQAVWIIVSIGAPCFQPFAGVLPLFVAGAVGLGAALGAVERLDLIGALAVCKAARHQLLAGRVARQHVEERG